MVVNQTYKWKHNGAAPIGEILAWCDTELEDDAWYLHGGWEIIYFTDLESYKLFLLRWE
jgi:hypothetical protein